mgnify:CR=1 FL=1
MIKKLFLSILFISFISLFIAEAQTDKATKKTAKAYLEQADKYFKKFMYPPDFAH